MLQQCLDVKRLIFGYLDLQSLVNLLNCNNKILYWDVVKYVKWKNIYKDIIRYDVNRFSLCGDEYYPNKIIIISSGCCLDILKSLKSELIDDLMIYAALGGNLDNMKWLIEHNCPLDERTFAYAAQNGNLDNMKWLKKENCPWDTDTFAEAARNGNLNNMEWLKQNGCHWNESAFENAARFGNLNNMKWLKQNGCPWDTNTFEAAAENGSLNNMKWLHEQNCTSSVGSSSPVARRR